LENNGDPLKILEDCSAAMDVVGKRFESGEYFLPQLIMAGEMLKQISGLVKPYIKGETNSKNLGRVLMGTVQGDIHNIGKDIVVFMLEVNGFEVRDIGIDVAPEKFVEAIKDFKPQVVGMSGLLTLAFESMKNTVQAITEEGLRDRVKIMIGGGQTSEKIREYSGADGYGEDALVAVRLAREWTGRE
jgi:5-methyltetrahydrofolate--homocysteine methyltransferase